MYDVDENFESPMPSCTGLERKTQMYNKAKELFSTHKDYMLVSVKRVKSTQLKDVKTCMGSKVKLLFAKNKIVKKALKDLDSEKYAKLIEMLQGDVAVAFFDGVDPKTILDASEKNTRKAPAVSGDIAPKDVVIPGGPTGLDPERIKVFQGANISTKINKGKIDLINDHKLLSAGDKVTTSNAKLLAMLKIMPFEFGLEILNVFDNGEIYGKELLKITQEQISDSIEETVSLLAALSLGSNTTTDASVPFEIRNAFADVVKISLGTEFKIQEFNN